MVTLPGVSVDNLRNLRRQYSGTDSPEQCLDLDHFNQCPDAIDYCYNSRGFRDQEWPQDATQLRTAIWCVGDSYTVGLGSAFVNTWPQRLALRTGQRVVSVAMDGASNQWIARRAGQICREIDPQNLVIQWSYLHRREQDLYLRYEQVWQAWYDQHRAPHWPRTTWAEFHRLPRDLQAEIAVDATWPVWADETADFYREIHATADSNQQDIEFTVRLWQLVTATRQTTNIIHSTVPDFAPAGSREEFKKSAPESFIEIEKLDLARDGLHYGTKTADEFVTRVITQLA